jgi:hypothetical protein
MHDRRKHGRDDNSPTEGVEMDDEEGNEQIKSRRLGSLGRIIANTALVVERTESGSRLPPMIDLEALTKLRQNIMTQFFQAFNLGDMIGLAKLVQEQCAETCEMSTPDLLEPIHGRAAIMMLFSLSFENFPDGIYRELPVPSQSQSGYHDAFADNINVVSVRFAFCGTRVFDQPISELYAQVNEHWATVQSQVVMSENNLIDSMAYSWIPEGESSQSHRRQSLSPTTAVAQMNISGIPSTEDKIVLSRSTGIPSSSPSSTAFLHPQSTPASVNHLPSSPTAAASLPLSSTTIPSSMSSSMQNMTLFKTVSSQSLHRKEASAASSPPGSNQLHKQHKSPAWLKKFAKSMSTSFGSVANKIASSLTLKERQTKYKRTMYFEFDVGPENLINKITIAAV